MNSVSGTLFEKKIKPILLYVGTIGAILMSVAYIILMLILILGFQVRANFIETIVFSVITAAVGFIIMQLLKVQGIDFAKNLPNNVEILKKYNQKKPKKKHYHSLTAYWISTIFVDILTKVVTVAIATAGIIYIVYAGSQNYTLLLLAAVNLIMFACFGLLSLVSAYDFFNDNYIPYIIERGEKYERENQKSMGLASQEPNQQGNANLHSCRGDNILDSSVDTSTNSLNNTKCVVVDSCSIGDPLLGRTVYTGSATTNSPDIRVKEDTSKIKEN